MIFDDDTPLPETHRFQVYGAGDFVVILGAALGETVIDEPAIGDVLSLKRGVRPRELVIAQGKVVKGSSVGEPGLRVSALTTYSFLCDRGRQTDVVSVLIDGETYLLPLGPLIPSLDYTFINSTRAPRSVLERSALISFTPETLVMSGDGTQRAVEDVQPGDTLLSRDHGAQPIRWVGRETVSGEGQNAPIMITKGALNTHRDLLLSPDHRLFIYQQVDVIDLGQAEVLLRARYLVNGDTVYPQPMRNVTYIHLLLEQHEIIYAEGIPVESSYISPDALADLGAEPSLLETSLQQLSIPEPTQNDLPEGDPTDLINRARGR